MYEYLGECCDDISPCVGSLHNYFYYHLTEEKLAESTAANAALSAQLENIAPQLASLESGLTESRHKLKEEQKLRRAAEQAQDEADQRCIGMDPLG